MISKEDIKLLLEADDEGQYNPTKDKSEYNIDDERRPFVTLKALNKLKHIRLEKRKELMQDNAFIPVLYGPTEQDNGGMPAGL